MKPVLPILAAAALGLAGCASNLNVWRAGDTPGAAPAVVKGVPFRTMQTFEVTGTYTKHDKGEACDHTPFLVYETLPTGPLYYANVDTAQLAKTDFSLEIKADGTLSKLAMNSEPSSDAIDSVTGALTSIAGLAGIGGGGRAAAAGAGTSDATKALCNAGPVIKERKPLN